MKADVLRDLPSKTEQTVLIELDQEHLRLYHQTREEELQAVQEAFSRGEPAKGLFRLLKAMTILRRLAGIPEADDNYTGISAKREYFLDMVDNLSSEGHKCLVFTNFLATVDLLSEDLANRGLANLVMTGATVDRQALVRRFQTDPEVKVLIMTLKTGGVGLNLTAADYVFIFDPWWNRSAETQAIDRVHRIGQTKPVFSYRLIARGTIEERILLLQEQKVDLVSNVLQGDGDLIKSLSPEDIRFLLSGT
jgi:SNF2 family DNA or RNA helicase